MNFYILDAGGAFLIGYFLIIFLAIVVLLEWLVLILFRINKPGRLLLHSFIVNLVSLALGYVLSPLVSELYGSDFPVFMSLLLMFAATFIVEGVLLILLNKQSPVNPKKIWLATLLMNTITYAILYFWL